MVKPRIAPSRVVIHAGPGQHKARRRRPRAADVTIVGGGPAGAALAVELGRRGMRVVLYEKARHPRFKPCGEGLLPHGVAALREIVGVPDAPRVRGLRFQAAGMSVDADFPAGHGLVVRRDRFDAWLFERAASTPNVDARPGTPYRGERARVLVGADGARSMFHRRLRATVARPLRVGLSTHVAGVQGLGDRVEVFFHDDGELYLAATGGGEALVAALFDYARFRPDGVTHLLSVIPELRDRATRIEFTTPVLAAARAACAADRRRRRGVDPGRRCRGVARPDHRRWHGSRAGVNAGGGRGDRLGESACLCATPADDGADGEPSRPAAAPSLAHRTPGGLGPARPFGAGPPADACRCRTHGLREPVGEDRSGGNSNRVHGWPLPSNEVGEAL